MAKSKDSMNTIRQQEKRWTEQQKKDREEFLSLLEKSTDLEVFEIYEEVAQSDDWDGAFSDTQLWKCGVTAAVMRSRLEKKS